MMGLLASLPSPAQDTEGQPIADWMVRTPLVADFFSGGDSGGTTLAHMTLSVSGGYLHIKDDDTDYDKNNSPSNHLVTVTSILLSRIKSIQKEPLTSDSDRFNVTIYALGDNDFSEVYLVGSPLPPEPESSTYVIFDRTQGPLADDICAKLNALLR